MNRVERLERELNDLRLMYAMQRDEIERLREANTALEKQLGDTQIRCSEIGERLFNEIERLREKNNRLSSLMQAYCDEFTEEAPYINEFWEALQQNGSE